MQSRIARIAVVCTTLLLVVPAGASADRQCHSQIKATTYELTLRGSNGYQVEIESFRSGKVTLTAQKETGFGGFVATYAVKGQSDERGLKADFGQLGRIAVHIRRQRPTRFAVESVRLEGRIEFHGEQGFTSVSLRRARGAVSRTFKRACPGRSSGRQPRASHADISSDGGARETGLVAAELTSNRAVSMEVRSGPFSGGKAIFALVSLEERREGMRIERGTIYSSRLGTVSATPPGTGPLSGNVALPYPFSGTAAFSRDSDSPTSWSGDLAVSMPGAPNVPLTGPGFSAVACSGKEETNRLERCADEMEDLRGASILFALS